MAPRARLKPSTTRATWPPSSSSCAWCAGKTPASGRRHRRRTTPSRSWSATCSAQSRNPARYGAPRPVAPRRRRDHQCWPAPRQRADEGAALKKANEREARQAAADREDREKASQKLAAAEDAQREATRQNAELVQLLRAAEDKSKGLERSLAESREQNKHASTELDRAEKLNEEAQQLQNECSRLRRASANRERELREQVQRTEAQVQERDGVIQDLKARVQQLTGASSPPLLPLRRTSPAGTAF